MALAMQESFFVVSLLPSNMILLGLECHFQLLGLRKWWCCKHAMKQTAFQTCSIVTKLMVLMVMVRFLIPDSLILDLVTPDWVAQRFLAPFFLRSSNQISCQMAEGKGYGVETKNWEMSMTNHVEYLCPHTHTQGLITLTYSFESCNPFFLHFLDPRECRASNWVE